MFVFEIAPTITPATRPIAIPISLPFCSASIRFLRSSSSSESSTIIRENDSARELKPLKIPLL